MYFSDDDDELVSVAGDTSLHFVSDLLLGGLSAATAKTITAPVKTISAAAKGHKIPGMKRNPYTLTWNAFVRLSKQHGLRGLWRGNAMSVLRYTPIHAFNFAFRNCYKHQFPDYPKEDNWHFVKNVASGSMAAASTQFIMHPVMICHSAFSTYGARSLRNECAKLRDCMRRTVKYRGIAGLYEGFYGFTLALVIYRGLYFTLYDTGKLFMRKYHMKPNFLANFILAQMATATAGILAHPVTVAGQRLMSEAVQTRKQRRYIGVMDCWIKMYYIEGPGSLFTGCLTSLVRSTVTALVLAFYDEYNYIWHEKQSKKGKK